MKGPVDHKQSRGVACGPEVVAGIGAQHDVADQECACFGLADQRDERLLGAQPCQKVIEEVDQGSCNQQVPADVPGSSHCGNGVDPH